MVTFVTHPLTGLAKANMDAASSVQHAYHAQQVELSLLDAAVGERAYLCLAAWDSVTKSASGTSKTIGVQHIQELPVLLCFETY